MTRPKQPPQTKARIYNQNYYYAICFGELVLSRADTVPKPWVVYWDGEIHKFHTHAKAVAWATKRVREGRK